MMIKDLQSTHQAEKDNLKLELGIFKKVIYLLGAKLRYF